MWTLFVLSLALLLFRVILNSRATHRGTGIEGHRVVVLVVVLKMYKNAHLQNITPRSKAGLEETEILRIKAGQEEQRRPLICGFFNWDGFNYVGPKQTLHTNQGLLFRGHQPLTLALKWLWRKNPTGIKHKIKTKHKALRCSKIFPMYDDTASVSKRTRQNLCAHAAFNEASIGFRQTSERSINHNQRPRFGESQRGGVLG